MMKIEPQYVFCAWLFLTLHTIPNLLNKYSRILHHSK